MSCVSMEELVYQDKLFSALKFYQESSQTIQNEAIASQERAYCLFQTGQMELSCELIKDLKKQLPNDFKLKYIEIKIASQKYQNTHDEDNLQLLESISRNIDESGVYSDGWRQLTEAILSYVIRKDWRESQKKFDISLNEINEKEQHFVAFEIGTFYHYLYNFEPEQDIHNILGISKQDCLSMSLNWFERIAKINTYQTKGYFMIAEISLNLKEYEKCQQYCIKALESESTKEKALILLSDLVLSQNIGELHIALQYLQQAQQENIKNVGHILPFNTEAEVELSLYQAKKLSEKGFIKEAVYLLEKQLIKYPTNAYIYVELGHIYFLGGEEDMSKSLEFYMKCYEVDPQFKDPSPAIAIGSYYLEQVQNLQELLEIDDQEELNMTRQIEGDQNNIQRDIEFHCKKALEYFSKALKIDESKCLQVHKSMAICHRLLNNLGRAVACYEKELEQNPEDIDSMIELIHILKELNNKKRAISLLEKVFFLDQMNQEMFSILCELLDNNSDRIVNTLKKIYEKNSNKFDNIAQLIARTYLKISQLQQFKQAEKWLKIAMDINPTNSETLYTHGLLFLAKGQPQDSLDWFVQCLEIDPDHEECQETVFELFETHLDVLNKEQAFQILKTIGKDNEEWLQQKSIISQNEQLVNFIQNIISISSENLKQSEENKQGE